MKFCHITPIDHLDLVKDRDAHLTLAHIVSGMEGSAEQVKNYCAFYSQEKMANDNYINIMDNSAFELYKNKMPMFNPNELLDLAKAVSATHIVLPDHPAHPSMVTIDDAKMYAPLFKEAGFGTFFVPQSDIGDLEDLITAFAWGASSPLIDYIGISILAVPNAYGCETGNNLQRYNARYKFMNELYDRNLLQLAAQNGKKIHFLGMVDGPNEIQLVRDFHIDTWDSSAGVWAGLNGMAFDNSPTGLVNGKFEKHVDFTSSFEDTTIAKSNIDYIDNLVTRYNHTERL
tara:strand:- start:88 stop:948 length:861 start_codon:yes stop_codon:yes gene_type:complete